jgi:hypothetical protein
MLYQSALLRQPMLLLLLLMANRRHAQKVKHLRLLLLLLLLGLDLWHQQPWLLQLLLQVQPLLLCHLHPGCGVNVCGD